MFSVRNASYVLQDFSKLNKQGVSLTGINNQESPGHFNRACFHNYLSCFSLEIHTFSLSNDWNTNEKKNKIKRIIKSNKA